MKFEKLGNIVVFKMGQAPHSDTYNDKGEGMLLIKAGDFGIHYPTPTEYTTNPIAFSEEGDVLICVVGATSGKVNKGIKASITRSIAAIRTNQEKLNSDFLFYYLRSSYGKLNKMTSGSAQGIISKPILAKIEIPLPPLSDQIQIASLLSKAENLIAQRKESIRLLDEFLKSTFLEMFGDPVRNEKKWEVNILNKVINGIESGWSPVCLNKPRANDSEWAILKLGSVTHRKFNPSENKLLDQNLRIKKELTPQKGNLLFSRKNTYELVGATVFVFEDHKRLLLPDTIFKINYLDERVSGLYLWFLFNDLKFRKVIQSLASGSAGSMPNISKEKLSKLKISLPPIELQTQFALIVEKTEALRTKYLQSLQELENLNGSLSQRAFRGELRVSRKSFDE